MNRVEPNRNVYVGHRYVPLLVGEWDKSIQYEGLSIVTFKGASYTSKKMTPPGIDIENEEYWVVTGNYDAQVEYYRQDVERVQQEIGETKADLEGQMRDTRKHVDDSVENLTGYVDNSVENLTDDVNVSIRNILDNYNYINVSDYEGTDDVKFQNALNDAISTGKTLFISKKDVPYSKNEYTEINDFDYVEILSNGAVIDGKGFSLTNGNHIKIDGLYFKDTDKTMDNYSDGIRGYNIKKVDIMNNIFDTTFLRFRKNEESFNNDYVNIINNHFTGNIGSANVKTYSNLIECYGLTNIIIDGNNFFTDNAYRMIKLSTGQVDNTTIIKEKGYADNVKIINNTFKGSVDNKQVIDCYAGIDNILIDNNKFETLNSSAIFESKIASSGEPYTVDTLNNIIVTNNIINVEHDSLPIAFRIYSYKNTDVVKNSKTGAIFNNNIFNNISNENVMMAEFRGFNNINVTGNISKSLKTTGKFNIISAIAVDDVLISNNIFSTGGVYILKNGGTSRPTLNYSGSPKNITINSNIFYDIRDSGGIYLYENDELKNLNVSDNTFILDNEKHDYILSVLYLRDSDILNANLSNNTVETNDDALNRNRFVNTPVKKLMESNNSWNPLILYDTSIPTEGNYNRGDRIEYTNPSINAYLGAVCVSSGSPGLWNEYGLIAPNE